MAEIKLPTMSYKEIGEKGARYALDEVEYKGLTIRQWADKITGGEYAPVVHGHWVSEYIGYGVTRYRCSRCGVIIGESEIDDFGHSKYCCMCGAKMDGEEHNNV